MTVRSDGTRSAVRKRRPQWAAAQEQRSPRLDPESPEMTRSASIAAPQGCVRLIFSALLLVMLLASLDQTIVSTALGEMPVAAPGNAAG